MSLFHGRTKDELRQEVTEIAQYIAAESYRQHHPQASDDEVNRYAERHYRQHWDDAVQVWAIGQAAEEDERAAQGN